MIIKYDYLFDYFDDISSRPPCSLITHSNHQFQMKMSTEMSKPKPKTRTYRYFGSSMGKPMNLLSNFSQCEIECEMYILNEKGRIVQKSFVFPSAESAWWAHFLVNECDISRLAIGGDLSTLESGLTVLLGENIGPQKAKYWQKKDNVGIVAKMLAYRDKQTNVRTRAKKIGIEMTIDPSEVYGMVKKFTLINIWKKILIAKYSQNILHRRALLSTDDAHLVEFCRMNPEKQFWAAQIQDGTKTKSGIIGGKLVGNNFMGKCLMATRKEMKKL